MNTNMNTIYDMMHELPTDIQRKIYLNHKLNYLSHKRYIVEAIISLEMAVTSQTLEEWNHHYPGTTTYQCNVFPLSQVLYDSATRKWHKPGCIVSTPLPEKDSCMPLGKWHKVTEVGFKSLPEKKVDHWMKHTWSSSNAKNIKSALDHNAEEGIYCSTKKYNDWYDTNTWSTYYSTGIRVREVVYESPSRANNRWVCPYPGYFNTIVSNFNPYRFHTTHTYYKTINNKNVEEVWNKIKECLIAEDFSTIYN